MSSLFHKTVKGFSWTALEQISGQLIQLGLFVLLARLLTKEAFGLIALANVVVTFLQIFISQGFNDALIQRKEVPASTWDTAFWANLGMGVLMAVLSAFVLAPLSASFFEDPILVPLLQVFSISFVLGALMAVPQAQLKREMEFKPLAIRSIIGRVVGGAAALWVAMAGGGVWSLVCLQLVTQLVSLVALWLQAGYWPRLRYDHTDCKEMLSFGSNLIGFHVINFLNRRYDVFLLGKFFSIDILGVYSVAQKIIELSVSLFMGIFGVVGYPLMCRLRHDMDNFRKQVTRLLDVIMYACVPFTLALWLFADPIIRLLFGEKWMAAVPMMVVMAPMLIVRIPTYAEQLGLTALGKPSLRLYLGLFGAAVSVALFSITVSRGIEDFVLASSLRYFILAVPTGILFCRYSGIGLGKLLSLHLVPLLVSALTIGVASAAVRLLGLEAVHQQLCALALGAVAFVLVAFFLKRGEIMQLKGLLRRGGSSAAS